MKIKKHFIFILLFISLLFISCKNNENGCLYLTSFQYSLVSKDGPFLKVSSSSQLERLNKLLPEQKGTIWLHTTFKIPKELENQPLGLYLGNVKIAEKVYLNGNYIGMTGSFPPNVFSNGELPSYHFIPSEMLKSDGSLNDLTIEIWVDQQGLMDKYPFIDVYDNVYNKFLTVGLRDSKSSLIVSYIMFIVAFIYFVLFIFRNKDKSNLSFSRLNLCSAFYMLTMCVAEYPRIIINSNMSYLLYLKLFTGAFGLITTYFTVSFIRDYLGARDTFRRKIYRICITIIPVILVMIPKDLKTFYQFLYIAYVMLGIHMLYAVKIIYICIKKRNKRVTKLLIGFSPVILSILIEVLLLLFGNPFSKLIIVLGWQLTILTFLAILIISFAKMGNQVEFLNNNLEKLVKERTNELECTNKLLEETNTHLEFEKVRSEKEIDLAAFVQQSFYRNNLPKLDKWDIGYYFKPLIGVSGDLYDFFTESNDLDGFGIFDVSGHGISSGLVTMLVKNIIHQEFYAGTKYKLTEVMDIINGRIIEEKGNIENYLTGILARVLSDNKIEFVNAGHPLPLMYLNNDNKTIQLACDNPKKCGVIGIPDMPINFDSQEIIMNKGDSLLLYTDGITEASNNDDEEYGIDRLSAIFNSTQNLSINDQIQAILQDVKTFINSDTIGDDITILIFRKK